MDKPAEINPLTPLGRLVWAWGVGGTCLILVDALIRLVPLSWEALAEYRFDGLQWTVFVIWVLGMAYGEGYVGFQQRFSPRVVARSRYLGHSKRWFLCAAAPLIAMGLFHATRRRIIGTWALVLGIVGLVILIRELEQPWRGIIDSGVVVGLSWGLFATLWIALQDLLGRSPEIDPDLPKTSTLDLETRVSGA